MPPPAIRGSRSRHWAECGFTVMELVIGLAIAGLVGSLLFAVWTFTLAFTKRGSAEVEAQQHGRIALTTLVNELRETLADSEAVAVWSTDKGAAVDAIAFPSARVEAGRPFGLDAGGNATWLGTVYYVHDRGAAMLRRQVRPWDGRMSAPPANEGRVVARGVREVRFARDGDLVSVALRVAVGRREITLQTSVAPRN